LNFIKGLKTVPKVKIDEVFLYIRNFLGYIFDSMSKVTNLAQINNHFESVNLQNVCTFTMKTIKTPAIVKIDNGQIVLVDRLEME
jgi:hypothetical protein